MAVNYQFLARLKEIYNEGTYKMTRARWKDGAPARTLGIYQSVTKN